jgi:hypothetical protein
VASRRSGYGNSVSLPGTQAQQIRGRRRFNEGDIDSVGIANAIMQGILSATFLRIDRIRSCKSEFCVIERHIAIALGPIRYF